MKEKLKRLLWHQTESTASKVRSECSTLGIPPDEITTEHLMEVYLSSKYSHDHPRFQGVAELLPRGKRDNHLYSEPVTGLILETRKHPALFQVIHNVFQHTRFPVQLIHGERNRDYILHCGLSPFLESGRLSLLELPVHDFDARSYNSLFLTRSFWDAMKGRNKILVFQTDSILCPDSSFKLEDFLEFDYIGSMWPRKRHNGMIIDGGVGGLSIRDWKHSTACLEKFPPCNWRGGEDGYFGFHLDLIGRKVGRFGDCAAFSTQYEFLKKSWGAHSITCLSLRQRRQFLRYCPEATFMVDSL